MLIEKKVIITYLFVLYKCPVQGHSRMSMASRWFLGFRMIVSIPNPWLYMLLCYLQKSILKIIIFKIAIIL